jgi:hypothetical protein
MKIHRFLLLLVPLLLVAGAIPAFAAADSAGVQLYSGSTDYDSYQIYYHVQEMQLHADGSVSDVTNFTYSVYRGDPESVAAYASYFSWATGKYIWDSSTPPSSSVYPFLQITGSHLGESGYTVYSVVVKTSGGGGTGGGGDGLLDMGRGYTTPSASDLSYGELVGFSKPQIAQYLKGLITNLKRRGYSKFGPPLAALIPFVKTVKDAYEKGVTADQQRTIGQYKKPLKDLEAAVNFYKNGGVTSPDLLNSLDSFSKTGQALLGIKRATLGQGITLALSFPYKPAPTYTNAPAEPIENSSTTYSAIPVDSAVGSSQALVSCVFSTNNPTLYLEIVLVAPNGDTIKVHDPNQSLLKLSGPNALGLSTYAIRDVPASFSGRSPVGTWKLMVIAYGLPKKTTIISSALTFY